MIDDEGGSAGGHARADAPGATEFERLGAEIDCSMSRKGNCWDNAVAEGFNSTLKTEHKRGVHFFGAIPVGAASRDRKSGPAVAVEDALAGWYAS